jgi:SAM-dependent methyltransferase
MLSKLSRYVHRSFGKEYVEYDGSIIPSPDRRWCGPEFKDNSYYVKSAEKEAQRLAERSCTVKSSVLDLGCGQGRLAIGLLRVIGEVDYTGMDIDAESLALCRKMIQSRHPSYRFAQLNAYNSRYNPSGVPLDENFRLEMADATQDFVYLYSVFSHMTQEDMVVYLREIYRVLSSGGLLFFTTFVEDDVPPYEENPTGYFHLPYNGPLHVCRYQRNHLLTLLKGIGFEVVEFSHRTEADYQSGIYCRKLQS